jgi:hypothetical protein
MLTQLSQPYWQEQALSSNPDIELNLFKMEAITILPFPFRIDKIVVASSQLKKII